MSGTLQKIDHASLQVAEQDHPRARVTDRRAFNIQRYTADSDLEVWYGLPGEVRFCKHCNISNQQPMSCNEYLHSPTSKKVTIGFDEEGVCRACRVNEWKADG